MTVIDCNWKPDFEKWYNVNKDAYKFIFDQGEKKLEDVLSESESITNKAIKMIVSAVVMFSFFVSFLIQLHKPIGYNLVFYFLFIGDIVAIIFLIRPKEVKGRGFAPSELLPKKLDNKEDEKYQEELLYYFAIVKMEEDIQIMRKKNSGRANLYLGCLILTIVVFVAGSTFIMISL